MALSTTGTLRDYSDSEVNTPWNEKSDGPTVSAPSWPGSISAGE